MQPVFEKQAEKRQNMDSLFKEHGIENKPKTETGSAFLYGFRVFKKHSTKVRLQLYFLYHETTYVAKITHDTENPHKLIKFLRHKNQQTIELSEMINTEVHIKKKQDTLTITKTDTELTEFNHFKDDWTPPNSIQEETIFKKLYTEQKKENKTKGEGLITEYYVQKSAGNITQELEIGLNVKLPDGTTEQFECIHDKDHPDECLVKLLPYSTDSESISGLKGQKIPVIYNEWTNQWEFHIKRHILDIKYYYERITGSVGEIQFSNRTYPIDKTYKSADNMNHSSRFPSWT